MKKKVGVYLKMNMLPESEIKNPTAKQLEFRNRKKIKGLARATAIFELMKAHNFNLPSLEIYINKKDESGNPFYPDVTFEILPDPKSTISRARLQQILSRSEDYKAQSSWKSTRAKVDKACSLISPEEN
jgi:hypothetical protein